MGAAVSPHLIAGQSWLKFAPSLVCTVEQITQPMLRIYDPARRRY